MSTDEYETVEDPDDTPYTRIHYRLIPVDPPSSHLTSRMISLPSSISRVLIDKGVKMGYDLMG